jgi:flap endonuclease-1
VPEGWNYKGARKLFVTPEVTDGSTFEVGLPVRCNNRINCLVHLGRAKRRRDHENHGRGEWIQVSNQIQHGINDSLFFSEDRIRNAIERLKKTRQTSQQGRIDSFFKSAGFVSTQPTAAKRKLEEEKKAKGKKKGGGVPAKKRK